MEKTIAGTLLKNRIHDRRASALRIINWFNYFVLAYREEVQRCISSSPG